jgi:hypothetical protein
MKRRKDSLLIETKNIHKKRRRELNHEDILELEEIWKEITLISKKVELKEKIENSIIISIYRYFLIKKSKLYDIFIIPEDGKLSIEYVYKKYQQHIKKYLAKKYSEILKNKKNLLNEIITFDYNYKNYYLKMFKKLLQYIDKYFVLENDLNSIEMEGTLQYYDIILFNVVDFVKGI